MEDVGCLLCGCTSRRIRVRGRDRMCHVPGEFTLVECANCRFLFLSPRPSQSEIGRYYPAEYTFYTTPALDDLDPFYRSIQEQHVASQRRIVLDNIGTGRDILDVGCASGTFLGALKADGWSVRGIEPDARAAGRARELYGIDVFAGYLEDAPFAPASFDAITLWEVFEHVHQPRETLRRIHDLLKPGGMVIMSVPNRKSFQAKVLGAYWIGYDFPRHLSIFSPDHLAGALRSTGFEQPRVFGQRGRLGAMHNELFSLFASVGMWLGKESDQDTVRRLVRLLWTASSKPAGIVPLFLLTLPLSVLLRRLNRGTNMVAVARKPHAA